MASKAYIVTGSSSGIGFAIAQALVRDGHNVVIHGSSRPKVEEAARQLGKAPGLAADLQEPGAGEEIVSFAIAAHGRIDGVVNNAGIFPRGDIDSTDAALFERIFAINVRAPLLVCKAAVAAFRSQGSAGAIVNIGSLNAWAGQTDLLPYSMSKGALMTMTRNLGDALSAEKIRVNQLNVGWTVTDTEIATQRRHGRPDDWFKHINPLFAPTGNLLTPAMVAEHVLFWLSERSAPVTGQVYEVEQYPVIGRNPINRL